MYLLDLSDPEKSSKNFGMIQMTFDRKVDFLVWILAASGIRFSPFDSHVNAVSSEEYSITLNEWLSWLNKTIADNDPRWSCQVEDIEAKAQTQIEDYKKLFPEEQTQNLDWASIRAFLITRLTWSNEQYKQVVREYSSHESKNEFIQDSRLSKMWELYQSSLQPNPHIEELLNISTKYPSDGSNLIRKIYLVNYPKLVKYSINISTIIGVPKHQAFNIQSVVDQI